MPSTATITTWYNFTAGTTIRSSEVNNNFSIFRGHILPVDPNTTTAATSGAYDLGASDHYWRHNYLQASMFNQHSTFTSTVPSGFNAIYFKSDGKAYTKNNAGTETALGGGALVVTGTRASPTTITAAGITYSTTGGSRQQWYILGDTTTGTDITANPQISAGSEDGQELILVGRDDSRTVIFEDGNGLSLKGGSWTAYANSTLYLRWDTSVWVEVFSN
jgi:hypothetical protein